MTSTQQLFPSETPACRFVGMMVLLTISMAAEPAKEPLPRSDEAKIVGDWELIKIIGGDAETAKAVGETYSFSERGVVSARTASGELKVRLRYELDAKVDPKTIVFTEADDDQFSGIYKFESDDTLIIGLSDGPEAPKNFEKATVLRRLKDGLPKPVPKNGSD